MHHSEVFLQINIKVNIFLYVYFIYLTKDSLILLRELLYCQIFKNSPLFTFWHLCAERQGNIFEGRAMYYILYSGQYLDDIRFKIVPSNRSSD